METMQNEHSKRKDCGRARGWRKRLFTTLSCLVLTGATTQACGDTEGESSGSVESFDDLLDELAASICRGDCGETEGTYYEVRYGADCLEIYSIVYESVGASIQQSLDAGKMSFDAKEAQRCLDLFKDGACDEADRTCEEVFVGKVAVGDACTSSTECAGDAYCQDDLQCPGTCAPTAGPGEACAGNNYDECGSDGYCSIEGACIAQKANGEPCEYSDECRSFSCDYDSGRCVEIPEDYIKDVGESCDYYDEDCKLDLYCSSGGTCEHRVEVGEACQGGECVREAYCSAESDGICVARIPVGEDCEDSDQCTSGICDGGVCEKLSGLGGPCVTDERCFGVCEDGACAPYPTCDE